MFHLYEISRIIKFIETESITVVTKEYETGNTEFLLKVYKMMNGGYSCTTPYMYLMPLNYTANSN